VTGAGKFSGLVNLESMTDNEQLIAETAICRRDMTNYDEIHHDVAHALDMKKEEVVRTLDALVGKLIVKKSPEALKASYEKGALWDK
jgi:hypothetical protein